MMRPLRVVVVDDHPLVSEGIGSILRAAGYEVAGTASGSQGLLALLGQHKVDAVTMDIGLPGLNGIELARQVRMKLPYIRIVFVTQQTDAAYLQAAMQAGALGFVSKQSAGTELVMAMNAVTRGRRFVSPTLIEAPQGLESAISTLQRKEDPLTLRQREVLQRVAEGKSVKEIAAEMNISTKTVEFHKQALVQALGIRTTAELTRYAITHGHTFLPR